MLGKGLKKLENLHIRFHSFTLFEYNMFIINHIQLDKTHSKSAEVHPSWGFNSPSRHQPSFSTFTYQALTVTLSSQTL